MEPWAFDSKVCFQVIGLCRSGVLPLPIYLPVARTDDDLRTTKLILRDTNGDSE
jgi:hypothetical protein